MTRTQAYLATADPNRDKLPYLDLAECDVTARSIVAEIDQ